MCERFILRAVREGVIVGCCWPVEKPKKVVCIVHGIGEHCGRYQRLASRFNEAGYAVLSMDMRGHGLSFGKRGDCSPREDVLDDLSALLTCAQIRYPDLPVIFYGHSMGGSIILDYRSRGGLNDLPAAYMISAPWLRLLFPIPEPAYWIVRALAKIVPRLTAGASVDDELRGNPEIMKSYGDDPMSHNRMSARCAVDGYGIGRALERGTLEDNRRAAKIPTLLIHGGDDQICDIRASRTLVSRLREQGDNIELIEWPGLRHEIHNGGSESKGDEVIERMISFFDSI